MRSLQGRRNILIRSTHAVGLAKTRWNGRGSRRAEHRGRVADGDGGWGRLHAVSSGLRREHAFCLVAVAFSLAVLFVGVLHTDVLVHEVLVVHVGDGVVGGFEVGIADKAVAFGEVGFVAGDLRFVSEGLERGRRGRVWEEVRECTFGWAMRVPKRPKVSYRTRSSTMGSRLPMKSSAPTSTDFCLSALALLTRMGLPNRRT